MNIERRRAAYKAGTDASTNRRNRLETRLQIRKNKKEENLRKRRELPTSSGGHQDDSEIDEVNHNDGGIVSRKVSANDIPYLVSVLANQSATLEETVKAVVGFRRLLSIEKNPPVNAILSHPTVLPALVTFLSRADCPVLMFEAAWALTNVASTHRTNGVVEAGAVPPLLRCLHYDAAEVREQAAWCLGNIAGESCDLRDTLLQAGAMESLILNVERPDNRSLLANVTWSISNLCRGKPSPDIALVQPVIKPMTDLLRRSGEIPTEILVDAAWALSYLSDGDNSRIEIVMGDDTAEILVSLLEDKRSQIITPIVRCLGNFVTGNDMQTQAVIDAGVMSHVIDLLQHPRNNIRKETCWLLSNIAAGSQAQIQKLYKGRGRIIRDLVEITKKSSFEVKKEALYALCNIFTMGNEEQVMQLVNLDGLMVLASEFKVSSEVKMLLILMEALDRALLIGANRGKKYVEIFDEYDGIEAVERLQEHSSDKVYEAAVSILEKHFGVDDDDNISDENVAPVTVSNTFAFGMPSKQLFTSPTGNQGVPQFGGGGAMFNFNAPNGASGNYM